MTNDREKSYQKRAATCVKDAQALVGDGWRHFSVEIQWGLVCANIVALINAQDDTISAESVRAMHEGVTRYAHEMIHGE